jgi:hypothetical protein
VPNAPKIAGPLVEGTEKALVVLLLHETFRHAWIRVHELMTYHRAWERCASARAS